MTAIYHITHLGNLESVISKGGLRCDRQAQGLCRVQIGHSHIKARRMNRVVPLPPGGTLGDYVPFYFAPRSPMLYAISCGAVEGYAGGQREVIHLVSAAETAAQAKLRWVFTEGHAEIAYSTFFNDLADLDKIDSNLMSAMYWADTNADPDRKRRRQAEFLVCQFFPWELVSYIGAYDNEVAEGVIETIQKSRHRPAVGAQRTWYY